MPLIKTSLLILSTLLVNTGSAALSRYQSARPAHVNAGNPIMPDGELHSSSQKDKAIANGDIVKLAEGSHSEVTSAFLVVARDQRVYSELQKLVPGLPHLL